MSYNRNILLLYALSSTTGLTLAAALVVPFFLQNGLTMAQVMLLQAIFSLSVVLFEVPTGYVADRYGRAMSLRIGSAVAALGFMGYAVVHGFWLFVAIEILLALGFALLSGADEALAYDSLLADGREGYFRRFKANLQSLEFGSVVAGAPLGSLIAAGYGLRTVLFLNGLIAVIGFACSLRLTEPPLLHEEGGQPGLLASIRRVIRYCLHGHEHLPLLLLLGSSLSAATYFGYWLAPAYYISVGIPLAWFGIILAIRNVLKALLSQMHHVVGHRLSDMQQLSAYSGISIFAYLSLALLHMPAAILLMALFDVVQALQGPVVSDRLHALTPTPIRAQVMSVASLGRKAMYGILGPLMGLGVDHSVRFGFLLAGVIFAPLLLLPLIALRRKGAV